MHVPSPLVLDGGPLSIDAVVAVARSRQRVAISDEAAARVRRSRAVIEHLLDTGAPMYGITTGFGALRGTAIPPDQREELQRNLIRSHASGMGPAFSEEVVRAAILLRANTLCQGYSGVRLALVEAFLAMLNSDLYPYVPQQGSVGASGDLAPLSHLGLVLMGDPEGRVLRRDGMILWVNTLGDQTPIHLPPSDVLEAMPGVWSGRTARAGTGFWLTARRV